MENVSLFLPLVSSLLAAGALYGAIRQDLKHIHERIGHLDDALDNAHRRIDDVIFKGGK